MPTCLLQDLYEEIEKQRLACERIINSKDKLISGELRQGRNRLFFMDASCRVKPDQEPLRSPPDIKSELKKKDDEFVKTLKRQAEDIDTLLQYMSRQFVEMQGAYKEELEEIENAFLQVQEAKQSGENPSRMIYRCLAPPPLGPKMSVLKLAPRTCSHSGALRPAGP